MKNKFFLRSIKTGLFLRVRLGGVPYFADSHESCEGYETREEARQANKALGSYLGLEVWCSDPSPFKPHCGNSFVDANGVKCVNWQMVGSDGVAYAFADFEGGECVRYGASPRFTVEAQLFFDEVGANERCNNIAKWRKGWEAMKAAMNPSGLVVKPLFVS